MALPRVLVVDDSAFARTVLTRIMRASGLIEVIGTARDGDEALTRIKDEDPDVVTLDLTMPGRDGLGVLRALEGRQRPRVIVVSVSTIDSSQGVEALSLGAIDLISKPSALATDRLYEIGEDLIAKVLAVQTTTELRSAQSHAAPATPLLGATNLVMIGTSTGGPQALTRVLAALPGDLNAPIAMVLHIPVGYTEALAKRLDDASALEVIEAYDGVELKAGRAVLARAGQHLKIRRVGDRYEGYLELFPVRPHIPAVDELFTSGARAAGSGALGVVLTGMGDDGLIGARAISSAKGKLLTESASSCVVYGMPRCVFEAGIGARAASLDSIPTEIIRHVNAR